MPEVPPYQAGRYGMYEIPDARRFSRVGHPSGDPRAGPRAVAARRPHPVLVGSAARRGGLADLGHWSADRIAGGDAQSRGCGRAGPGGTT